MAFKASAKKKLEVAGIEAFIEKKFAELKQALSARSAGGKKAASRKAGTKKPSDKGAETPLAQLLAAVQAHPRGGELAKAGKQKDQLLRSLIPLYLARELSGVEVTSGTTSKFWAHHKVTYAAPNAAKALREHAGYARRTAKGPKITPAGIKYVEAALGG
jgi:hypothetical protein